MKAFLENGVFGGVSLGVDRSQLEDLFGLPDDIGGTSRKYRRPSIWKYGDVEFHFEPDTDDLWLIYLDDFTIPRGGKSIDLDPWIINDTLILDEAQRILTSNRMSFVVKPDVPVEGSASLITGAGIHLIFSGSRLRSVSYSNTGS